MISAFCYSVLKLSAQPVEECPESDKNVWIGGFDVYSSSTVLAFARSRGGGQVLNLKLLACKACVLRSQRDFPLARVVRVHDHLEYCDKPVNWHNDSSRPSHTFCCCPQCSRSDLSGGVHWWGRKGPMGHGTAQIGPSALRLVYGATAEEEILTFDVPSALSYHYLRLTFI